MLFTKNSERLSPKASTKMFSLPLRPKYLKSWLVITTGTEKKLSGLTAFRPFKAAEEKAAAEAAAAAAAAAAAEKEKREKRKRRKKAAEEKAAAEKKAAEEKAAAEKKAAEAKPAETFDFGNFGDLGGDLGLSLK